MKQKAWPEILLRVATSLIFVAAGLKHIRNTEDVVSRLIASSNGLWLSDWLPLEGVVFASGVAMLIGGIALMMGFMTRWAAIGLIACLVPITLAVQLEPGATGPLLKNVSIFGTLVYIASHPSFGFGVQNIVNRKGRRSYDSTFV